MVMAVEDSVVQVMVRLRPPTPRELESQQRPVVQVVGEQVLVFDPEEPDGCLPGLKWGGTHDGPKKKGKDLTFVFDRVFGEAATQQDVFQHTTHSVLDSFLQGYNCSGEPGQQGRRALVGGSRTYPLPSKGVHVASSDMCPPPPGLGPRGEGLWCFHALWVPRAGGALC